MDGTTQQNGRLDGTIATSTPATGSTPRSTLVASEWGRSSDWGEPWRYELHGITREVTVSVIVPARNEAANIVRLFSELPPVFEVVLVDGRSVDGTADIARAVLPHVRLVDQPGRGKGDAMRAGLVAATGDISVFIDADGSNVAGEIERFVLALVGGADMAKGSRFLERGGSTDITGVRRLGNWGIRTIVNTRYGTRFTDIAYGFNALWTDLRDVIDLDCTGFEVETLMHIRAARAGLVIEEVPSFEGKRSVGATNLHALRDGLRIAALLVREHCDEYVNGRQPASVLRLQQTAVRA